MALSTEQLNEYVRERIEWAFDCNTKSSGLAGDDVYTGGAFGSKCLLPPWAFAQKPIVTAVNKLNNDEKCLVKFVVGLTVEQDDLSQLMLSLWSAFYQQYLAFHRLNASSFPKAQRLLELALINYKLAIEEKPLISDKEIRMKIGVTKAGHFTRDWSPRLKIMGVVIASLEQAALVKVLAELDVVLNNKRGQKRA